MRKWICLLLVALMALGMTAIPAFAENKEAVKVYYFDSAVASREASDPAALEKLRQWIIDEIGIDPRPYVAVAGAETQQLNLLLAGGEPLDMFIAGSWRMYAAQGLLQPVNALLEEYGQNLLANGGITETLWKAQTDADGNIWGVPRMPAHVLPRQVQVRQDWLDAAGIAMPANLEELEAVFEYFAANDPTGKGNQIVFLTNWGDGFINGFLGAYIPTGSQWWLDEEGTLQPYALHAGYKQALEKFNEWYAKGYIYPESFQIDTNQRKDLLMQNRVVVYNSWYSTVCNAIQGLTGAEPNAMYQAAVDIVGPNGTGLQTFAKVSENGHVFLARSQNPEAMMRFMDWQSTPYTDHLYNTQLALQGPPELLNLYTIDEEGWSISNPDIGKNPLSSQEFYQFYCPDRSITVRSPEDPYYDDPSRVSEYMWCYLQTLGYDPVPYPNMGVKGDDYAFLPDTVALDEAVPTRSDLDRMIQEEGIKFITGQRSFDTFDKFLEELDAAGMQVYIAEYNRQFQAQ